MSTEDALTGAGAERSGAETGAPLLVVSQFTLHGDTRKGRRPSWIGRSKVMVMVMVMVSNRPMLLAPPGPRRAAGRTATRAPCPR